MTLLSARLENYDREVEHKSQNWEQCKTEIINKSTQIYGDEVILQALEYSSNKTFINAPEKKKQLPF